MEQFIECTHVVDWKTDDEGLRLRCSLGRNLLSELLLTPHGQDILRVEFEPVTAGRLSIRNSIPLDKQEPVTWTVEDRKDHLILAFQDYEVKITLKPFGFCVTNRNTKKTIVTTIQDDYTTWNFPLTRPLGITAVPEAQRRASEIKSTHISFLLGHDEKLYGMGEQFTSLNHRGRTFRSWNENGMGTRKDAYKSVPFYFSSSGYGLLVNSYYPSEFDLGCTSNRSTAVTHEDSSMELFLFFGDTPAEILQTYTRLTGRSPRIPRWALGLWISTYFIETDEKRVKTQIEEYRNLEIPVDVYHFDCFWLRDDYWNDFTWDPKRFPEPEKLLAEMHNLGFTVSVWENPYISIYSDLFKEADEKGYLLKDRDGKSYIAMTWREDLMPATGIVDFSNPEAYSWWQDIHRRMIKSGVDVFKTDFGEAIPDDCIAHDGTTGKEMHNRIAELYNSCVFEVTKQETGNGFVWARTAWAGTQRYPTHWAGDPHCTWEDMASSLRSGLNFSLSGFAHWSHDIGGFKGVPNEQLYCRWAQFGLLSPQARLHGWSDRDPWAISEKAVEVVRTFTRLRYSLMPYLEALSHDAYDTGAPLMRPLVYQFPNDPVCGSIDTQFMLGDALMVVPVLKKSDEVLRYLPEGNWFDLRSAEVIPGGGYAEESCPLEKMPLYLHDGHALLRSPVTQFTGEKYDTIMVEIFLQDAAVGTERFDFSQGSIEINWKTQGKNLSIKIDQNRHEVRTLFLIHGAWENIIVNDQQKPKRAVDEKTMHQFSLFHADGHLVEAD